jgi:hypothetical protein
LAVGLTDNWGAQREGQYVLRRNEDIRNENRHFHEGIECRIHAARWKTDKPEKGITKEIGARSRRSEKRWEKK